MSLSIQESNFVILDPLNVQNNTTKNSYRTKEILTMFRRALSGLQSVLMTKEAEGGEAANFCGGRIDENCPGCELQKEENKESNCLREN
mmetsp:Transcript_47591/g.34861  ORF Transcript_47591/g.34861 Transcript_47591/m.34861 type:complete len:89 (-) Transcript_47591:323-589(-)